MIISLYCINKIYDLGYCRFDIIIVFDYCTLICRGETIHVSCSCRMDQVNMKRWLRADDSWEEIMIDWLAMEEGRQCLPFLMWKLSSSRIPKSSKQKLNSRNAQNLIQNCISWFISRYQKRTPASMPMFNGTCFYRFFFVSNKNQKKRDLYQIIAHIIINYNTNISPYSNSSSI